MNYLNFKKETKGFKYLCEAIYLSIIDENALDNLSNNVFSKIARKYHTNTSANVKWCMNRVIDTMYCNTSMKTLCEYFKMENDQKQTLKFIIYFIVCKYYNENELSQ